MVFLMGDKLLIWGIFWVITTFLSIYELPKGHPSNYPTQIRPYKGFIVPDRGVAFSGIPLDSSMICNMENKDEKDLVFYHSCQIIS